MNFTITLIPLILYVSVSCLSFIQEGNHVRIALLGKNDRLSPKKGIASIESRALIRTSCDRFLTPSVHVRTELLRTTQVLRAMTKDVKYFLVDAAPHLLAIRALNARFGFRMTGRDESRISSRFVSMAAELSATFEGRGRVSIRCDDPEQK